MLLCCIQVIGAGAVGLAIARQLATRTGTSTILIERHDAVGTETSSRNSEVMNSLSPWNIYCGYIPSHHSYTTAIGADSKIYKC